jgi:hypothetical protein
MILHCVFIRFQEAIRPADKQALFDAVAALKHVVPGITGFAAGPNVSPEGLDGGFRDGFTVHFESEAARDAYLVHPDHVAVGGRIVAAAEGGTEGLLVFDLKL